MGSRGKKLARAVRGGICYTPLVHSLSRRDFLGQSAVSGLALATGTLLTSSRPLAAAESQSVQVHPAVGSQLYGWGQYYEREGKHLEAQIGEALSALRDAGYDYAEGSLDTATPDNNARFADQLRAKGMRPVSLYTGGTFHTSEAAPKTLARILAAARVSQSAGFAVLVCNPDPIGREKTDAELETQASALRDLGQGLREIGLRFGLHHHTPEMKQQAREFHSNFRKTQAGVVDFCFDVHWIYRGGLAPMKALAEYHDRVVSWHLRQSREQIWWEDLATGDIDYAEIARFVKGHHLPQRFSVELALEIGTKITRSVVENHRRSRAFVKQIFGV